MKLAFNKPCTCHAGGYPHSVDTSDSVLDTTWFHEIYILGQLAPPADIAALVCWLVGPWSRMCKGEFFFAAGAAWMAQVQSDLA